MLNIESPCYTMLKQKKHGHSAAGGISKTSLCDLCDLQVLCVKPYSALIIFVDSVFLKLSDLKTLTFYDTDHLVRLNTMN